jgi:hypothetical protein
MYWVITFTISGRKANNICIEIAFPNYKTYNNKLYWQCQWQKLGGSSASPNNF